MKILYAGHFLGEGLRQNGHEVIDFTLKADCSLKDLLAASGVAPDLVLIELWGNTPLPLALFECRYRLAAYCIDSPLNAFWLAPLLPLFDNVFVDQLSSVATLKRHGINAVWLPLCVFEADFRSATEKEYDLAFVGRTTASRSKRKNLLHYLQRHVSVHVAKDVSRAAMLDIFARSHAVLNENLFSGLTLRVLQGLASGSLVFTEEGGHGVDRFFEDGRHLICYNPENILKKVADIQANAAACRQIALEGQRVCREGHTSRVRAKTCIEHIEADSARNPRPTDAAGMLAEAKAVYLHSMRFGGSYAQAMRLFSVCLRQPGLVGLEASHFLGSIAARKGDFANARLLLEIASRQPGAQGFVAAAKLAAISIHEGAVDAAISRLAPAIRSLSRKKTAGRLEALSGARTRQALFLFLARVLLDVGQAAALGFEKPQEERFPDYALEYARLAWKEGGTAEVLDVLVACARACGVEPEILPTLTHAIETGVATDTQIAYTAELAIRYYDAGLAKTLAAALRQSLKHHVAKP
jgi:hypothetical protein